MFQSLEIFQTSHAMARHAAARQAMTATNLANADTPGYQARAMPSFAETMAQGQTSGLRATRSGHVGGTATATAAPSQTAAAEASPNGNSVSVEQEMLRGVEIQREHSRALTIYKHSLDVLRASIGRR